jgi:hypothetical protein
MNGYGSSFDEGQVGFTRGVVVMDLRMVSSTMAMIEGAHDFDHEL